MCPHKVAIEEGWSGEMEFVIASAGPAEYEWKKSLRVIWSETYYLNKVGRHGGGNFRLKRLPDAIKQKVQKMSQSSQFLS